RSDGYKNHHEDRARLLRGSRSHTQHVETDSGKIQRLDSDSAQQHVSVAAYFGRKRKRSSIRSSDTHRGDAQSRRRGYRRALEIQREEARKERRRRYFHLA